MIAVKSFNVCCCAQKCGKYSISWRHHGEMKFTTNRLILFYICIGLLIVAANPMKWDSNQATEAVYHETQYASNHTNPFGIIAANILSDGIGYFTAFSICSSMIPSIYSESLDNFMFTYTSAVFGSNLTINVTWLVKAVIHLIPLEYGWNSPIAIFKCHPIIGVLGKIGLTKIICGGTK